MPEKLCGERIDTLTRQLSGLKARREELTDDEDHATGATLTDDDIDQLQAEVERTIRDGDPPTKKALMQALVSEIRVDGRDRILPTYLFPAGVAPPAGSVLPGGRKSNPAATITGEPISLR